MDGKVYGTSLAERKLYKMDLKTGKVLKKRGRAGWNVMDAEYLWPTCVSPFSSNELILSDAHTGFIYIINSSNLSIKKAFGGNGPGLLCLKMPYSVCCNGDFFFITSTFQGGILKGRKSDLLVIDSYMPGKKWDGVYEFVEPYRIKWKEYICEDGRKIQIFNQKYMMGYGKLIHSNSRHTFLDLNSPPKSPFAWGGFFYFMEHLPLKSGDFIFSPQNSKAYYISSGQVQYLMLYEIPVDCWVNNNNVLTPHGKMDLEALERQMQGLIKDVSQKRLESGYLPEESLNIFFDFLHGISDSGHSKVATKPYGSIAASFQSDPGKVFYHAYQKLSPKSTKDEVQKIARDYYRGISKHPVISIEEIFLVHMLTGVFPENYVNREN